MGVKPAFISSTPESASLLLLVSSTSRISSGSSFIFAINGGDSAIESGDGGPNDLIGIAAGIGMKEDTDIKLVGGDGCRSGDVEPGETLSSWLGEDSEV